MVVTFFYVGASKIELDLERHQARRRGRADVRHEAVVLSLECSASCRRQAPAGDAETR